MKNNGFTLVELAIVLVIIAFLAAGVFTGTALIRSAELREVVGDYDRYVKAIKEFEDKYQALPGDMNNAENIWGSDASCPNTPAGTTPKIVTCNGDGNGRIGNSSIAGGLSNEIEWFRAWQHLSNAGLITGKFTGTPGEFSTSHAIIGQNVPQSPLSEKSGWTLLYYLLTTTNTNLWGDNYGHILVLGANNPPVYTNAPALSPSDALSIDQKIDDGLPGRGAVRAWRTALNSKCTTKDTSQDAAVYDTHKKSACSLLFILGF